MLSRLDMPDRLVEPLHFESPRCVSLMTGCNLLLAMLLVGCISVPPREAQETQSIPVVASAPNRPVGDWSSLTRDGRAALLEGDFQTAETLFLSALMASNSLRSRDVRVDVSFGNLVRLAAVYERIGRQDDAKRVIAEVESSAGRRRIAVRRIAEYRTRYENLSADKPNTRREPIGHTVRKGSAPYDRLIRNTANSFDVGRLQARRYRHSDFRGVRRGWPLSRCSSAKLRYRTS